MFNLCCRIIIIETGFECVTGKKKYIYGIAQKNANPCNAVSIESNSTFAEEKTKTKKIA
jgi:hypothetical protein